MSFSPSISRKPFLLFGILSLLCLAQVGWWTFFLFRETARVEGFFSQNLSQSEAALKLQEIQENARKSRVMILAEGITFLVLVSIGVYVMYVRLKRDAASIDREKRFLSAVTHELKTPVASIGLAVSIIENNPKVIPEVLPMLGKDVKRLQDLIEQTLAIAIDPRTMSKCSLVSILKNWSAQYKNGDAELELLTEDDVVAPVAVVQVVLNTLFENSRKFSKNRLKVQIRTTSRGFIYEDNGPGLSFSKIKKFQRSDPHIPGQGVGLFLVEQLLSGIDSRIILGKSETLNGAKFEVEFA